MITIAFILYAVISLGTIYLLSRENEKKDLRILDLSADTVILRNKLEAEEKLNADIKARFVRCNTCTTVDDPPKIAGRYTVTSMQGREQKIF